MFTTKVTALYNPLPTCKTKSDCVKLVKRLTGKHFEWDEDQEKNIIVSVSNKPFALVPKQHAHTFLSLIKI